MNLKYIKSMNLIMRDRVIFFCGVACYPAAVLLLWFLGKPMRRHLLFVSLFLLLVILELLDQDGRFARNWALPLIGYSSLFAFPLFILDAKSEINYPFPFSARRGGKTQRLLDLVGIIIFFGGFLFVFACPAIVSMALCQTPVLVCDTVKLELLHASLFPISFCLLRVILTALSGILLVRHIIKAPIGS